MRHVRATLALSMPLRVVLAGCAELLPSVNGPCVIGWGAMLEFADDGTGEQLLGTWIANDLLIRDGPDAVDDAIHDAMDACAGAAHAD